MLLGGYRELFVAIATSAASLTGLLFVAAAFAAEIVMGAELLRYPGSTAWLQGVSYILIAALLAGVARAWEIVGGRDAGTFASLAVLTGRDRTAGEPTE